MQQKTEYVKNATGNGKEWNNEHGMNRRRFLRQAVLAGSTFCVASTTGKAVGSEPAVMNISGRPYTGLAGMAAVHNRRTLGSGTAAMNVSAMGFGCMGLNHHRSQHPVLDNTWRSQDILKRI